MPETIGQRLRQIRLARQVSLEKVSEATRVRIVYLQALENDDFSAMSSAAQGRGFLRLYADFLGMNLDEAMSEVRQSGTSPAPVAETHLAATASTNASPASEPKSAPPADGKPGRRGFWSRLLRRPAPEPSAGADPAPEGDMPSPEVSETPPLAAESAPAPESSPPARARAEKRSTAKKAIRPKEKSKAKSAPKPAGKKKQPLKSRPRR